MSLKFLLKELSYDNISGEGFWGNIGAGVLPISQETGRILLPERSWRVNEPNTWGVWGGKVEEEYYEKIEEGAIREFKEETEFKGNIDLIEAHTFESERGGFKFYNFIGLIDEEFVPELGWETQNYKWVTFEELQEIDRKHFGLKALLDNSKDLIERYTN